MGFLGVDFGTSTTVFAYTDGTRLQILPDDAGEDIIPSVLAFTPTGATKIGRAARNRRLIDAPNTIYSVKRIIGKPWHSPDVASFRKHYPFEMVKGDDEQPTFVTREGNIAADQILARYMQTAAKLSSLEGKSISRAMATVPDLANMEQQELTKNAVRLLGAEEVETVSEPIAATLAYLLGEKDTKTIFVYDFGGGTFDCAIVRWNGIRPVVVSSGGDDYLGGDDIDVLIADWACEETLKNFRMDLRSDQGRYEVLRFLCEQVKIQLSTTDEAMLNLGSVDESLKGQSLRLERDTLWGFTDAIAKKTLECCDNVIDKVAMGPSDMDAVIMVGGTSYSPYIRARVREHFAQDVTATLPPDRVVAMGAAAYAKSL